MKYLIYSENEICAKLSEPVIRELERFDIRNEIKAVAFNLNLNWLKAVNPDLFIVIGTKKSGSLINRARKLKIRTAIFYQTLFEQGPVKEISADKIFFDLPISDAIGKGNLLLDFLRSIKTTYSDEGELTPVVGIVSTTMHRWTQKFGNKLSKLNRSILFEYVNPILDLDNAIAKISAFNAVVCTDQFSSMLAVATNCPTVYAYKRTLFSDKRFRKNLKINEILGEKSIKCFPSGGLKEIDQELSLLLNDHEYSAQLLNEYQRLKARIGPQPFARQIVPELIDWLEND